MLSIVFLGTGSGIPTISRNHSSIYLHYEGWHALWDCGEGTQRQLLIAGKSYMAIDHIFITHWHADHWAGIIGLLQTMNLEKRRKPLYIYGPDAERFVADILDMDYWGINFEVRAVQVPYEGSEIKKIYEGKGFDVFSIPTKHSIPSVAYCFKERDRWNVDIKKAERLYGLKQSPIVGRLKKYGEIVFKGKKIRLEDVATLRKGIKVVYTGDTEPCDNIVRLAKDADILIHDSTFTEQVEDRMHSGAKEAGEIAKKSNVRLLVLTHFSRKYTNANILEKEAKKIFPNVRAARDFMKVYFRKGEIIIK
ncbi:MAG: ribonuclease Z [Candidatus Aenigmatarchaeota archaeon]|nr:MAG: ribonuclease Z [Candidatus Aenigmarchaeota archaeon]